MDDEEDTIVDKEEENMLIHRKEEEMITMIWTMKKEVIHLQGPVEEQEEEALKWKEVWEI